MYEKLRRRKKNLLRNSNTLFIDKLGGGKKRTIRDSGKKGQKFVLLVLDKGSTLPASFIKQNELSYKGEIDRPRAGPRTLKKRPDERPFHRCVKVLYIGV